MESLSRRTLLGSALAWTASSYAQIAGSNERIRIGAIGCGGMAGAHMNMLMRNKDSMNIAVTAVCDVYDKRVEEASKKTGGEIVKDYRRLLERKDIDYVQIATPEHWHCQMTLDALDAGKHIYVEKPMTHKIEEAKKVLAKAKAKPNVKLQVGVQGMSDDSYQAAWEQVKADALGKVVLAQIDYSRNEKSDYWDYAIDADAKPGVNLDWKAWLGSAPKREWDPNRFFRWRWFWDYSGGISTDLYIHRATRLLKALNLTFPDKVVATGGKFQFTDSKAEVPDTFNVLADYPSGMTMQLVSTLANDTPVEHMLRGHKATLVFTRTGFKIVPQRIYASEVKEFEYKKTGTESNELHHRNLQAAIRTGAALNCDATLGYYGVVLCEMSVESFRKRKYLAWDASAQRIKKA